MPRKPGAELITIVAAFLWGSSFVAVKHGLGAMDPFWFLALRLWVAVAFILVSIKLLVGRIDPSLLKRKEIWLLGALNAAGFSGQFLGLTLTTATKAALLIDINVVFVALFAIPILKDKLDKMLGLAVIIGLIGIFLVTTEGDLASLRSGGFYGDIIVFGAGVVWAFYIILQKKTVDDSVPLLPLSAWVFLTTAIFVTPFAFLTPFTMPSVESWLVIIYLGIFCTAFAYILWAAGLRDLSATRSSILITTEIVFALVLAWLMLSERLNWVGLAGGGLIMVAAALASVKKGAAEAIRVAGYD